MKKLLLTPLFLLFFFGTSDALKSDMRIDRASIVKTDNLVYFWLIKNNSNNSEEHSRSVINCATREWALLEVVKYRSNGELQDRSNYTSTSLTWNGIPPGRGGKSFLELCSNEAAVEQKNKRPVTDPEILRQLEGKTTNSPMLQMMQTPASLFDLFLFKLYTEAKRLNWEDFKIVSFFYDPKKNLIEMNFDVSAINGFDAVDDKEKEKLMRKHFGDLANRVDILIIITQTHNEDPAEAVNEYLEESSFNSLAKKEIAQRTFLTLSYEQGNNMYTLRGSLPCLVCVIGDIKYEITQSNAMVKEVIRQFLSDAPDTELR